jgi:glutathione S-transferase
MDFNVRWFNFGHPFSTVAFHEMAPTGQVPVLHTNGQTIWDSLAIAEYLAEQHPGVWPIDPIARAWARSASAEMHANFSSLRNLCPFAVACGPITISTICACKVNWIACKPSGKKV